MQMRKKYILHLIIASLALVGLFLFMNTFDPLTSIGFPFIKISPLIIFFGLTFLGIGGLSIFVLASIRRGILLGVFAAAFLLLQYLHYNNLLYTSILLVIVVLIEILFWKKK